MSETSPDNVFDLELHFLPAWAKKSTEENRYANYEGETARPDRKHDRPPRRRDLPPGPGLGPRSADGRPPRSEGFNRPPRRDSRPPRGDQRPRSDQRPRDRQRPPDRPVEPPTPLPEINVAFVPDDKGVESLARQIRMTGRAYPLFEIAQMVLAKPERHSVTFNVRKKPEGEVLQPLYLCALDETLWLTQEEAAHHLLERHFATFYQAERTQVEPPKGVYTFVAQCALSGVILGPPNHHDYQNNLRKLHAERFARMPFEVFKSRVRIVRDETVVKKWIEDQSWKTQYVCLNMAEPLRLSTREEVEKHFRETHLPTLIQAVETYRLPGPAARNLRDLGLRRLLRQRWEEQRRFPIQVATVLSQQFAATGLQFFKVNKTVTHVAVARPHYLDLEAIPVSESVRRIVTFVNEHPKCTHGQLLDGLAPLPAGQPEGEPTPERTAIVADLHWLVHEGHVIEFANGVLETAKKPLPRPPKPAPAPVQAPVEGAAAAPEAPVPAEGAAATPEPGLAPAGTEPPVADTPAADAPTSAESGAPAAPEVALENPPATGADDFPPAAPQPQPPPSEQAVKEEKADSPAPWTSI